jgi:hypothetical protein
MGSASEGGASSSFNYAGGTSHELAGLPAADRFGLGTQPVDDTLGGEFE